MSRIGADPASPAVRAQGLSRRYGRVPVLRGLDLVVERGRIVSIFGSNGAGKTTLLRTLAGLLRPDRGSVEVLGTPQPGGAALRRRIGWLDHRTCVYDDLTTRENLLYYGHLYGLGTASPVDAQLEAFDLGDVATRPTRNLSRGMRQRLALARATLHEPELLLLDEPFTGLDPRGAESLTEHLIRLREGSVTIVLTTHQFERALSMADAALLLHAGRVAWRADDDLPSTQRMREIYAAHGGV